jgi:hypothetical protein
MSNLELALQAVSPTPVDKRRLIEPEATDRFAPRPWMHFPPGALFLVLACLAMLFVAAFQSGVQVVRRDGLREGIEDAIPIPLPAFAQPAARPAAAGHVHHAHRRHAKLHLLLQQSSSTPWSHDGDEAAATN